jgi:hypothetical protein
LSAEPISGRRQDQIESGYFERRVEIASETEEHFRALFSAHVRRLAGVESCLDRFLSSAEALRQQRTRMALTAVEESHNELCIAEELLLCREPPFSLIEYEPPLPCGDQRIDFRATNDRSVWFVEVKTIHPELKDRWDQYQRIVQAGHITDNVTIHFEKQWMGGQLWHQKFSARAKMLEYSLEFEDRIRAGGVDSPKHGFILAFFSDGFAWDEDELEDFVAFYRTGRHRLDDGLAKMEKHALEAEGRSLMRRISAFAYFCRPPFEQAPTAKNWNVRPPTEPC